MDKKTEADIELYIGLFIVAVGSYFVFGSVGAGLVLILVGLINVAVAIRQYVAVANEKKNEEAAK